MDQATISNGDRLWTVILAAGSSSRLGYPKQLLRVRGQSLLQRSTALAQRMTGARVVVVIGARAQRLRSHLRRNAGNVRIVLNNRWHHGMGTSLATGIGALPKRARGALILLCDQPDISAAKLARLIRRWRRQPSTIVAAGYGDTLGVPAVFPRSAFAMLRTLSEDTGARALLNDSASPFRKFAIALPEARNDIDTPADTQRRR